MRLILLFFLFFQSLFIFASDEWTHLFGGTGEDVARKIIIANGGGWITAGFTTSYSNSGNNAMVVRWDGNGDIIWQKVIGDSLDTYAYSVAQDLNGFIYVAGSTNGTGSLGSLDMYLAKLDSSGNVLWEKTYGGTQSDQANSVVVDSTGNVLLAGTTQSSGFGGEDGFVLKTDSSGTILWSKTFGRSSTDNFNAIAPIRSGGYVLVGYTNGYGANHGYVVRINNNGDSLWTNAYNLGPSSSGGIFYDVKQKDDSSLIYTGVAGTYNYGNMFHLKTDLNGSLIYFRTSNRLADGGYSIITTDDGGYLIAGSSSNFGICGFLRKFSTTGTQVWERYFKNYYFHNYVLFAENFSVVQNDNGTFTMAGAAGISGSTDGIIINIDSSGCIIPVLNTPLSASPSANFCDSSSVNTTLIAPNGFVSYQWFVFNGSMIKINGADSSACHILQAGTYYCLLTSDDDVYYSTPIVISVTTSITHPLVSPAGVFNGCLIAGKADGLLSTSNVAGYNYQWLLNGNPIALANSSSYYASSDGLYSVIVYNTCGVDTSDATDMRLNEGPHNATLTALQNTTFCSKSQSLALTSNFSQTYYNYQWLVNNNMLSTGTNQSAQYVYVSGYYSLIVSNQCGTDTSNYLSVIADSNSVPTIGTIGTSDLRVYVASGTNHYCGSQTLKYSGQSVSAPFTFTWKLNGVTLPATGSSYRAVEPGDYTLTLHDTCGTSAESAPFTVNAIQGNDSIVVTSTSLCSYSVLTVVNQGNSYQWYQNGQAITSANPSSYTTSAAGNYFCTFQPAGCLMLITTDTVSIAATAGSLYFSASPSTSVCSGSIVLTASIPNAFYVWKLDGVLIVGANSQSYTATQTGTYFCVISKPGCQTDSSSIPILIGTNKITSDRPILCPGYNVNFRPLVFDFGAGYQWRRNGVDLPGETHDYLLNINQTGIYDVRITNTCGTYLTNSITLNSAPRSLSPSGTIHLCEGDTVHLSAPAGMGYKYNWYNNSYLLSDTTQSLTVSSLALTFCCNTNLIKAKIIIPGVCYYLTDADTIIPHKALPNNIFASTSATWCGNDNVQLNARKGTGYNYQWYKNALPIAAATNDNFMASDSGDYYVSIGYYPGCASNSNIISVNNNTISGSIAVTESQILCHGDSVQLQLTPAANFYQWSHNTSNLLGATSQNYSATDGGIYSVVFSDNSGCRGNESVTIYSIPFIDDQIDLQSANICTGDSVKLTLHSAYAKQWYFNGMELSGETGYNLYASQSGNYKVVMMQSCCVISDDSVDIQITSIPFAHISSSQNNLCNSSFVTLTADPGVNQSYQWKRNGVAISGATSANYNAVSDGIYACEVTSNCGVAISNDIAITSSISASLSSTGPTTFCNSDSLQLIVLPYSPSYTYQWRRNNVILSVANSNTYYASSSANYSVEVSDTSGCFNTTNVISVNALAQLPMPVITTNLPILCPNSFVDMSVDSSVFNSYQWRQNGVDIAGETYASYSTNATGMYDCAVTSSCGSGTSLPVYVSNGISPVVNLGNDTTLCVGSISILRADYVSGYSYLWQDNSTNSFLYVTSQVQDTNLVFIQVSNLYGCSASDSILLTFSVCTDISSPETTADMIFFPNPVNDHLFVYAPVEQKYIITIIDLIGRIILIQKSESSTAELDMSQFSPGAYLVRVNSDKRIYQKKVIKE